MTEISSEQGLIRLNYQDLADVEALLRLCDLPFEDCAEHIGGFVGCSDGNRLCAVGGMQHMGPIGLLRSIAVHPECRGQGLAADITRELLERARASGVTEVYLLTETAEQYFRDYGFFALDRNNLPPEIKSTRQFESLCPSSAQAMRLDLSVNR